MLAGFEKVLWRIPGEIPSHAETRTLNTSNCAVRIRDSGGAGQALVFLCDPPITVEAYDELINSLKASYRVVVIELPGFGFSRPTAASALTFSGAVQAAEEALVTLKLESLFLFGPCICGFVAAELVRRQRLPVKGLVLMQTPDKEGMQSWVKRMDPKGILRVPIIGQLVIRFTAKRIAKFWLHYATAKNFEADGLVESSDCVLRQGGGYALASMLQLWGAAAQNANLDVPALAIWGKQDRSHKATPSNSSCKHAPNADVIEFADCGHFTELEQPKEFIKAVTPFIEKWSD